MALGYDGKLYILAFDHRGSFQKKMFGIEGDPTPEQTAHDRRREAPDLRGHGAGRERGVEAGADRRARRRAVRRQHPRARRKAQGLKLAMPVEKSGQNEFDFQYGDDFGEHIEQFDPDFSKVLVRYNPDDGRGRQRAPARAKLKRLADWLHANDRMFLFELLVPAEEDAARPRSAATPTATTPSCARS